MARLLKSHKFKMRRARRKYPWHKWTNGRIWCIYQGEDYDTERCVSASLYNRAKMEGKNVQVNRHDGHIIFQFRED